MVSEKVTLVVDADMLLYKITSATEHAVHWGDDLWVLGGNLAEAKELLDSQVATLCERFETDKVTMCITGADNYRKHIDPAYKAHRKSTRKPLLYPQLKAYMSTKYHTVCEEVLEADDLCGLLATDPSAGTCVIVSDDKDMFTLPCAVFRLGELTHVTPDQAWRTWLIQTLTGDATDGYAGAKGYGPKTAEKALGANPTWADVVECYVKSGQTADDALRNARLSRILQHGEYDFETKQVQLWEPESNGQ